MLGKAARNPEEDGAGRGGQVLGGGASQGEAAGLGEGEEGIGEEGRKARRIGYRESARVLAPEDVPPAGVGTLGRQAHEGLQEIGEEPPPLGYAQGRGQENPEPGLGEGGVGFRAFEPFVEALLQGLLAPFGHLADPVLEQRDIYLAEIALEQEFGADQDISAPGPLEGQGLGESIPPGQPHHVHPVHVVVKPVEPLENREPHRREIEILPIGTG